MKSNQIQVSMVKVNKHGSTSKNHINLKTEEKWVRLTPMQSLRCLVITYEISWSCNKIWDCLSWLLNEVFAVDFCMLLLPCFASLCAYEMTMMHDITMNPIENASWMFRLGLGWLFLAALTFSFIFDPRLVLVVF